MKMTGFWRDCFLFLVLHIPVSYFFHWVGYVKVLAWSDECYFYGMKWVKVTTDWPVLCMGGNWEGLSCPWLPYTLNYTYNKVAFNEKSAIKKENLHTKYTPFTYKYFALNEKPPTMKQNLHIFFFLVGGVECTCLLRVLSFSSCNPLAPVLSLYMTGMVSLGHFSHTRWTVRVQAVK